ncbi:hypothetical protein P8T57_10460 [Thalassospira sp. SN3W]|uniref:hypothetical protein n=1 Tax=Thalassospira sp. SN3W TaxID=3035476 RepID=UPI00311AEB43
MNLTFGVCWIEDQASDAENQAIEDAIRSAGFEPSIERIQEHNKIEEFANRQKHFQDFELILLDLRLGNGLRGDELAPQVRNSFRSTPILFYSSEDETNLRKMMADKLIEGAYCAHRANLSTRVGELVSHLSPALNRLAGMRGLASRVVAECDREFRSIIIKVGVRDNKKSELVNKIRDHINIQSSNQIERMKDVEDLDEILMSPVTSSGILFRVIKDITGGDDASDEIKEVRRELRNYPYDILGRRNTLAHSLEESTEDGWIIKRPSGASDLTIRDFERYRRDFLNYLEAIRRLKSLVLSEEAN